MNTTFNMTVLGSMLAVAALVQGCANALTPLGENKYDCNRKENPASPYCHSFKSVETATNGVIPESRFDEPMSVGDHDRLTGIAPDSKTPSAKLMAPARTGPVQAVVVAPGVTNSAPLEGLPVRVGPVVQRIWVKRFVDRNDLLVSDTVIYKEVIASHWLGFDANTGALAATSAARGTYPHRPSTAQPQPSKSVAAAPDREPATQPRNSFSQPGVRGSGSGGLVPAPTTEASPASESGVSSMPQ